MPPAKVTYTGAGEWAIIIFIVLLLIAFIIWMVWYFGIRSKGLPPGSNCTANCDCEMGTFCSGDGTCQKGQGRSAGQKCDGNRDCELGLFCNCTSGTCQVSN